MNKNMRNRQKIKERVVFTPYKKNKYFCPGSVVAHHPSLSSLGLGFKFRPGRSIKLFLTDKRHYYPSKENYISNILVTLILGGGK